MRTRLSLILFLIGVCTANAQFTSSNPQGNINGSLSIGSPTATNLGKFGDIPVSLFTGLPNVSIPITSIDYHDIHLPIVLNYQYSGFRPNDHPSWVGLGWNLQAGGVIMRTKKGEADEIMIPEVVNGNLNTTPNTEPVSYFKRYSAEVYSCLNTDPTTNGVSLAYINFPIVVSSPMLDMEKNSLNNPGILDMQKLDTEPDEFNFNFNGMSGKFYLDASLTNRKWKIMTDQGISLTVELGYGYAMPFTPNLSIPRYISDFTLTAADGTKYYFGGNYNADHNIEVSLGVPGDRYGTSNIYEVGNNAYVSAWYLRKIVSPNDNVMELKYGQSGYAAQFSSNIELEQYWRGAPVNSWDRRTNYNTYSVSVSTASYLTEVSAGDYKLSFARNTTSYQEAPSTSNNWQGLSVIEELLPDYLNILRNEVYEKYSTLYQISMDITTGSGGPGGPAVYRFHDYWQKLNSISSFYKDTLRERFDLSYYTLDNGSKTGRLELKAINKIADDQKSSKELYSFAYHPPLSQIDPVQYGSRKIDNWGYYNGEGEFFDGKDTVSGIDITNSTITQQYDVSRTSGIYEHTLPKCVAGALTEIHYPSGGHTQFDYETNWYTQYPKYNSNTKTDELQAEGAAAGGIRLKQTIDYPNDDIGLYPSLGADPGVIKKYYYVKNYLNSGASGTGSGILITGKSIHAEQSSVGPGAWPYNGAVSSSNVKYPTPQGQPYGLYYYLSSNPVQNQEGPHIGYSEVAEVSSDGGFKIYEYSNLDKSNGRDCWDEIPDLMYSSFLEGALSNISYDYNNPTTYRPADMIPWARISHERERGKLIHESFYKADKTLVKDIQYTYNDDPNRFKDFIFGICKKGRALPFSFAGNYFTIRSYGDKYFTYYPYLKTKTENDYFSNGVVPMTKTTQYTYDQDRNLASEDLAATRTHIKTTYRYSNQFSGAYTAGVSNITDGLINLTNKGIKNALVEKVVYKDNTVIGANFYAYHKTLPSVNQGYKIEINAPISQSSFSPFSISNNIPSLDNHYVQSLQVNKYNNLGEALSITENYRTSSIIRDEVSNYVMAKISNAQNDFGYTSFEHKTYGNFIPENNPMSSSAHFTGDESLWLPASNTQGALYINNLDPNKTYVVSLWVTGNTPPKWTGYLHNLANYPTGAYNMMWKQGITTHIVSGPSGTTPGGWTYFQLMVNSIDKFELNNGINASIDEVRIFPQDAQMETYYAKPGIGILSSSDVSGHVQFYYYDGLHRLIQIKDQDGYLIKKFDYGF